MRVPSVLSSITNCLISKFAVVSRTSSKTCERSLLPRRSRREICLIPKEIPETTKQTLTALANIDSGAVQLSLNRQLFSGDALNAAIAHSSGTLRVMVQLRDDLLDLTIEALDRANARSVIGE